MSVAVTPAALQEDGGCGEGAGEGGANHGSREGKVWQNCWLNNQVLFLEDILPVQITSTMSKFEDLFEDLDVHTQVMDSAMSTATTLSTPEGQVDSLMKQVSMEEIILAGTLAVMRLAENLPSKSMLYQLTTMCPPWFEPPSAPHPLV